MVPIHYLFKNDKMILCYHHIMVPLIKQFEMSTINLKTNLLVS